jgi:uncharacterized protein
MITYSLANKEQNSGSFYLMLNIFTDLITDSASVKLHGIVKNYIPWLKQNKTKKIRSDDEYYLELIMMGVFWNNYASKAVQTSSFSRKLFMQLYAWRKKYPRYKKYIDKIRGLLSFYLLEKKNRFRVEVYDLENLKLLIEWMKATGEFNEEVVRLEGWIPYFETLTHDKISEILHIVRDFAISFNDMGRSVLGGYTQNVDTFREKSRKNYKFREDYFFTQRFENEYFMNMYGAEVLNRALKPGFDAAPKKAVLLPTCMRRKTSNDCKAKYDGNERICTLCDSNCNIGKVAKEFAGDGVPVYLISHSSSFSKFLKRWANQKETALIGVACVLNLLTGGYEMNRLNIASQCVFLDYCSCKNHWSKHGVPTSLNVNRMKQLMIPVTHLQGVN